MKFLGQGWKNNVSELKLVGSTGGFLNVGWSFWTLMSGIIQVELVILFLFLDVDNFVTYTDHTLLCTKAHGKCAFFNKKIFIYLLKIISKESKWFR